MKVIAFNGSPRPDGNTRILLDHVLEPLVGRFLDGRANKGLGFGRHHLYITPFVRFTVTDEPSP